MLRDDARLLDIAQACRHAAEMAAGLTREGLDRDRKTQYALRLIVQIVGEAARGLSEEAKQRCPEVPWQQIIAMRHRLVHDYPNVNLEVVWHVVTIDLPLLLRRIAPLLPPPPLDSVSS